MKDSGLFTKSYRAQERIAHPKNIDLFHLLREWYNSSGSWGCCGYPPFAPAGMLKGCGKWGGIPEKLRTVLHTERFQVVPVGGVGECWGFWRCGCSHNSKRSHFFLGLNPCASCNNAFMWLFCSRGGKLDAWMLNLRKHQVTVKQSSSAFVVVCGDPRAEV